MFQPGVQVLLVGWRGSRWGFKGENADSSTPYPVILVCEFWGRAWECAFLTSTLLGIMIQSWGPHVEKPHRAIAPAVRTDKP